MIDHVAIPVRDLAASRRFYEPLFEGLGAKVVMEWPGGVLFGTDDGMVALRESDRSRRSTLRSRLIVQASTRSMRQRLPLGVPTMASRVFARRTTKTTTPPS